MKDSLIFIVNTFHKLLVYFMIFGCFLPPKYLWIHLFFWPIVYLHWQFNDGKCCLTELELYLKNVKDAPTADKDYGEEHYFIKKILADYNINLTSEEMHKGTLTLLTVSWLVSLIRFLTYKNWFSKPSLKEKEEN